MDCKTVIGKMKSLSRPESAAGMARFGINTKNAYCVSVPDMRELAKEIGKDHKMSLELWFSGVHEAKILASMVDIPDMVSEGQMEKWVRDFDSWDVCDQVCSNLFDKTKYAWEKSVEWSGRKEEFVKRAGFVLMAALAVHDKDANDGKFMEFLPIIKRESGDGRNFVKKAVSWALRQIGKRNAKLNRMAVTTAKEIQATGSKCAVWIASDALRELSSDAVKTRLAKSH